MVLVRAKWIATATIFVVLNFGVAIASRSDSTWEYIESKKIIAYPMSRPRVAIRTAVSCKQVCALERVGASIIRPWRLCQPDVSEISEFESIFFLLYR
jgi:hypothetical protein